MATLQDAIEEVQAVWRGLEGVKDAPDAPPSVTLTSLGRPSSTVVVRSAVSKPGSSMTTV